MSLLLDALKKAADDKQKASRSAGSPETISEIVPADNVKNKNSNAEETLAATEELSLQSIDDSTYGSKNSSTHDLDDVKELILEDERSGSKETAAADNDELTLDEMQSESEGLYLEIKDKSGQDQTKKSKAQQTNRLTVSDDALTMLIYKTNRDVKRGRRTLFMSVFVASIAIIASSGIYYYFDMQAEIAALERKHQIEMLSMQAKTSRENTPEKSAIIRNLVSDADLDEKVQYAKKIAKSKPATKTADQLIKGTVKDTGDMTAVSGAISVHKTKKNDPVGEKLNAAWQQYENAQYNDAKLLYKDVIDLEENNRDALLGLGAIAVIEKNNMMAREIYLSLLKLDPRDPIAMASLASLRSDASSLKSDEEHMLVMQQKNPDAPHLNFALGNIYAQQDKWKSAQEYYFNAWQLDIENADYIYNLAVSMDQLNKPQQALNFYQDSLHKSAGKQVSFSREAVQKRINELSGS
jgi:tetratricopeptide (TPR) repeat protein